MSARKELPNFAYWRDLVADRNPKHDPKPGDILVNDGKRRCVVQLINKRIHYREGRRAVEDCTVSTWRKWAKGSTVILAQT